MHEISPCATFWPDCLLLLQLTGVSSKVTCSLQASLLSSCSVQARPRNLYSTSALPIHVTHLQVVVLALSIVAGRLNPEQVPEVDPDKVAVLCGDHPGQVAGVEAGRDSLGAGDVSRVVARVGRREEGLGGDAAYGEIPAQLLLQQKQGSIEVLAGTCSPGSMGRAGDKAEMQMIKKSRWVCSRHQQGPITDRVPTTQWVTWGAHRAATCPH